MNSQPHTRFVEGVQHRSPIQQPSGQLIRLSREQANRWLFHLNELLESGCEGSISIEELRNQLENACWLARWKRDEVVLDRCPSLTPGVLGALLQCSQAGLSANAIETLQEITQKLSGGGDN
jgi:hypothetical protein